MFLLSETELIGGIPLKNISRIDIVFYKSRNESLNIFNLELDFDENLIPLITSTLECQPILISRKTYFGIDNDYIIERNIDIDCNRNLNFILDKEEYCNDNNTKYTSFQLDIDKYNKNTSNQKSYWLSRKLHYCNVYAKSHELVQIYSREDSNSDTNPNSNSNSNSNKNAWDTRNTRNTRNTAKIFNPQEVLDCKEETVIYWPASGIGKFEICISSSNRNDINDINDISNGVKKCIWRLVVDIIEDNHFIDSKVDAVNTWLEKIHKIKSTIKIANQETNLEEI